MTTLCCVILDDGYGHGFHSGWEYWNYCPICGKKLKKVYDADKREWELVTEEKT